MKSNKYVIEEIKLARLLLKGYILEKRVSKLPTSGAIYVSKKLIGKKFKVILLPVEEEYNRELKI